MSKPNLQLIHCSNGVPLRADHGQKRRSFRPLVIDGGVRLARGEPGWDATLKLFDLVFLFSIKTILLSWRPIWPFFGVSTGSARKDRVNRHDRSAAAA